MKSQIIISRNPDLTIIENQWLYKRKTIITYASLHREQRVYKPNYQLFLKIPKAVIVYKMKQIPTQINHPTNNPFFCSTKRYQTQKNQDLSIETR